MKKRFLIGIILFVLICYTSIASEPLYPQSYNERSSQIYYNNPSLPYQVYKSGSEISINLNGNYQTANVELFKLDFSGYLDFNNYRSKEPIKTWNFEGEKKTEKRVKNSIYDPEKGKYTYEYEDVERWYLNKRVKIEGETGIYALTLNGRLYQQFVVTNLFGVAKVIDNDVTLLVSSTDESKDSDVELLFFRGSSLIKTERTNGYYSGSFSNANLIIAKKGEDIYPFQKQTSSDRQRYQQIKSHIYTDRPVYRPNQTVYFKAIFWEVSPEKSFLQNKPVKFTVKDPRYKTINEQSLISDNFGSVSGSFFINETAHIGAYRLEFKVSNSQTHSFNIKVEEYRKPEFKLEIKPRKTIFLNDEEISIDIEANYYFGEPVKFADVTYEVYESYYARPCRDYYYYCYYYDQDSYIPYYGGVGKQIFKNTTKIDSEGKAHFSFIPEKSEFPQKYFVVVKATDESRKTVDKTASLNIVPSLVQVDIDTQRYSYITGEEVKLEIYVNDFDGNPISTNVNLFVNSSYSFGLSIPKSAIIADEDLYVPDGYLRYSFFADQHGLYQITIAGTDSFGNEFKETRKIHVYNGKAQFTERLEIDSDKDYYVPGETAKIFILSPFRNVRGIFSIEGSKLYLSNEIYFDTFVKEIEFPIGKEHEPNIFLSAAYFKDDKLYTASSEVQVIPIDKALNISVETNKEEYGIRENAQYSIKVKDYLGENQPSVLSIGVVDEPIYDIYPENSANIFLAFNAKVIDFVQTYRLIPRNYNIQQISTAKRIRDFYPQPTSSYQRSYYESYQPRKHSYSGLYISFGAVGLALLFIISGIILIVIGKPIQTPFGFRTRTKRIVGISLLLIPFILPLVIILFVLLLSLLFRSLLLSLIPFGLLCLIIFGIIRIFKRKNLVLFPVIFGILFVVVILFGAVPYFGVLSPSKMMAFESATDMSIDSPTLAGMQREEALEKSIVPPQQQFVEPTIRRYFPDTILWLPSVKTDEQGIANVNVKLPDSLTTWRATIKAYTDDFKSNQIIKKTIVRKNLIGRLIAPRTFTQGDKIIVSGIAHNYLETLKNVRYKMDSDSKLQLLTKNNVDLPIKAGDEKRVDFTFNVTGSSPTILTFFALTDEESDAIELTIPVTPRGVYESEYESRVVENAFEFNINLDKPIDIDASSFELLFSGTLVKSLLDSLEYLSKFPYGSVEQMMNKFIPNIAVLKTIEKLGLHKEDLRAKTTSNVYNGLNKIYEMQNPDGSFGWWSRDRANAYMTAYVLYGMNLAKSEGFNVNQYKFNNVQAALFRLLEKIDDPNIQVFAYYAYSLNKPIEIEELPNLEELNSYGKALLGLTYLNIDENEKAQDIVNILELEALCDEVYCSWQDLKSSFYWRYNNIESTAWALKSLIAIKPDSKLIPKGILYLMSQKKAESWTSTKDTGIAVIAIADYLMFKNELTPNFTFKVYQDNELIKEQEVNSDNILDFNGTISLKIKPNTHIRVEKYGPGSLYLYKKLKYLVKSPYIYEKNNGIKVQRVYEKETVTSGEDYEVKLIIQTDQDYEYIQIEDYIPSGSEYVKNIANQDYRSYYRASYVDVRDEKIDFFFSSLPKGTKEIKYKLRAEIPGEITAMPATASIMYAPQVSGHSSQSNILVFQKTP